VDEQPTVDNPDGLPTVCLSSRQSPDTRPGNRPLPGSPCGKRDAESPDGRNAPSDLLRKSRRWSRGSTALNRSESALIAYTYPFLRDNVYVIA